MRGIQGKAGATPIGGGGKPGSRAGRKEGEGRGGKWSWGTAGPSIPGKKIPFAFIFV